MSQHDSLDDSPSLRTRFLSTMPSDHPKPDRCAAAVTEKIGLEIHTDAVGMVDELDLDVYADRDDEDRQVLTDEVLQSARLLRDDEQIDVDPEYKTVIDYLRSGFTVGAVEVVRDDGGLATVAIEDADPYVTNRTTDHQGYCLRYPMESGKCYVHGGASTGAPENNVNAMSHGLTARRSNYYEALEDEERGFVEAMVDSWVDNAPFERGNVAKVTELYRIAIDQHRLWNATDEYVEDGLVTQQVVGQTESGQPIEADDENPANLAYDRLDRTLYKKLKSLGCLSDPDSQQAEATESLAQKLSGLTGSDNNEE